MSMSVPRHTFREFLQGLSAELEAMAGGADEVQSATMVLAREGSANGGKHEPMLMTLQSLDGLTQVLRKPLPDALRGEA